MRALAPPPNRAVRYCVVRPDPGDPLESLSGVLRGGGVQIKRVDRRAARITGRIDPPGGAPGCRVAVSLFPRSDLCFVEIACEMAGVAAEPAGAEEYAVRLKLQLLNALPPGREIAWEGPVPPGAQSGPGGAAEGGRRGSEG